MISNTAKQVLAAYGGADLWQSKTKVKANVSACGWAFTLKQRPFFKNVEIELDIAKPYSKIYGIGKNPNHIGILDGEDVRIETADGGIVAERKQARSYFPYGRRLFYWDDLDMAYFANYAFWNYFTLPNLLLSNDIQWEEKSPFVLEATFPNTIPSHSKVQEFIFEPSTALLVQHNYTADIISKLATAAHVVKQHKVENGVCFPSRRIVTPEGRNGKALSMPVLIDITVNHFALY